MTLTGYKDLLLTFVTGLLKNKKFRQVAVLYSVNLIGMPLGIVISIILTRFLGAEGFGDYTFLNNVFNFSIVIFSFGFFQAGNRALVLNHDPRKAKEYYGAELFLLLLMFLLMAISLYIYGTLDRNLQEKNLQTLFFLIIPFSWIFILIRYFETLFQADNRINELAATRLFPKIGFFVSAVIMYYLLPDFQGSKLAVIWTLYLVSYFIVFLIVILFLKVSFRSLKERIREIWHYNKTYGFDVYTGSVFSIGFITLTGVLISYFSLDNTGVGYFGLAVTFASPLALIPNVIATTHYKDFSLKSKMPPKLIRVTVLLSITAMLIIWIFAGPFIRFFYGDAFEPVIKLNLLVSIGVLFHGFADFFNRFLGSHGHGKALRNSAILIGLLVLVLNLLLIPRFGETGAAFSKISSGLLYFILMIFYYKQLIKILKTNK